MKPSLDSAAKIAEIIGAIAVVLSLLYVGYQVQQNTRAVRSTVHQSLIDHVTVTEGMVLGNADLAEILLRSESDPDSLSPRDRLRLDKYIMLEFINWENAYLNYQSGLLDQSVWTVWDRSHYPGPDSRAYFEFWSANRDWFDSSFANHVDAVFSDAEIATAR